MKTLLAVTLVLLSTQAQAWQSITNQIEYQPAPTGSPSQEYRMLWVRNTQTQQTTLEQYNCREVYKRIVLIETPTQRTLGQNIWISIDPGTVDQQLLDRACRD
jgi:ribosomal protein S10